MENLNLYLTLAVLVFMTISFLIRKWSYGVTAMTCVIFLTLCGVIDTQTAFSGLSNTTTILVASMLVIAGAISKTSLVSRIRKQMSVVQGKNKFMVLLLICFFTAVLCQLMGMTAVMAVIPMLIQTLDDESDLSQSRMIFVAAAMICAWFGRFPIGMGAALPLTTNAYYEGLVEGHPEYMVGMFDFLKVGIFPSICLTIYTLLAWKLIPKQEVNASIVSSTGVGGSTKGSTLSKMQENTIFIVFIAIMLSFFFSNRLGGLIYVIPAAGVLVLIYTKALSVEEVTRTLSGDMIWMVAGVLVISSALSSSGAGEFVGNLVLRLLGDHPSGLLVTVVFCVFTTIMTNFLSNNACIAIMTPIAASTALAGGMNPKAVVVIIFCSACLAIAFPTGCSAATMAFSIGNHNPVKMLKFCIPYLLIGMASTIASALFFFPVYG